MERRGIERDDQGGFKLRSLRDGDLWTVLGILGKALPESLRETIERAIQGADERQAGMMVVSDLAAEAVRRMARDESLRRDVYAFLEDVSGIPAADIEAMPFGTTPKMIKALLSEPGNVSFFRDVFRSC